MAYETSGRRIVLDFTRLNVNDEDLIALSVKEPPASAVIPHYPIVTAFRHFEALEDSACTYSELLSAPIVYTEAYLTLKNERLYGDI